MTLRYVILVLLSDDACHGYRLKRRIEETVGRLWQVNVGQVYQTLAMLNRQGLVRSRMEPTEQLKMRRVYQITEKGRRALATWLRRRPARPGPVRPEIVVRLIGLESGDYQIALEQLRAEEEVYLKYLESLKGAQHEKDPASPAEPGLKVSQLARDIALCQARAHLGWLRACRDRVQRFHTPAQAAFPPEAAAAGGSARTD